jgi:ferredoxin-type protein NapF
MPAMSRTRALSRRDLLAPGGAGHLMPWTDPARIQALCDGCGACAPACPEGIVATGRGGHPFVAFTSACTFCAGCAAACDRGVFEPGRTPPWDARARIGAGCLEAAGISCRACEDACDADALRFRPRPGGRTSVEVDAGSCTGCGACVPICPEAAIEVTAHG